MALPENFLLSSHVRVCAASEKLAAAVFGDDWRDTCVPANVPSSIPNAFVGIAKGNVVLAYTNLSTTIWVDDKVNDVAGCPAKIHYYKDGKPQWIWRTKNGVQCDSPEGDPAKLFFAEDGSITHGHSTVLGREIDADECRAMVKRAQMRRGLAWSDANVSQDVVAVGMHFPAPSVAAIDATSGRSM